MNLKKVGGTILLAICDVEILGKTLYKGKIAFHVKEEFYGNTKTSIEEAIAMMEYATIVNIIGGNIVQKAIEKGYVHPEAVLNIEETPHAQIVRF